MSTTPLSYVNVNGDPVHAGMALLSGAPKRKPRLPPESFHKGWRVVGLRPGALEAAEKDHPRLIADAVSWNERVAREKGIGKAKPVPGPWDADKWMNAAKKQPVRSKPYELEDAAKECAALAVKAGWLRVEVVEIKKEKEATA